MSEEQQPFKFISKWFNRGMLATVMQLALAAGYQGLTTRLFGANVTFTLAYVVAYGVLQTYMNLMLWDAWFEDFMTQDSAREAEEELQQFYKVRKYPLSAKNRPIWQWLLAPILEVWESSPEGITISILGLIAYLIYGLGILLDVYSAIYDLAQTLAGLCTSALSFVYYHYTRRPGVRLYYWQILLAPFSFYLQLHCILLGHSGNLKKKWHANHKIRIQSRSNP